VSENPYHQIPYITYPRLLTHPDRLAAVGKLFGMNPAPLRGCRVLEIGCGDGNNLIPIAYALPESRFLGIDLAPGAIAAGRRAIEVIGLKNISLEALDLCTINASFGEFDYILAHGVYSWVPREVREGLMKVCGERLAPNGIAMVSYNALPGGYARQLMRDLMCFHTRNHTDPAQRIDEARRILRLLIESESLPPNWQAFLESEAASVLERNADSVFHDELEDNNHPAYFRDFAQHAARHGLQYLGEGEPHRMFDLAARLDELSDDLMEREQYLDFLRARSFRHTLLCRQGVELSHRPTASQMEGFLFSAPTIQVEGGQLEGLRGVRITSAHEAVYRVAHALGETFPVPIAFDDLVPYAGSPEALQEIIFGLLTGGFANLHVFDFPCEDSVTLKPLANRVVRYQAALSPFVASACHNTVQLDEVGRHLLLLMDGTRDHEQLARDLAAIPGAPPIEQIREHLLNSLEWLAAKALLEA